MDIGIIEPPTERAKRFFCTFDTVEDAVFMAGLVDIPEIEIYEAKYYYETVTLPAVMAKPWKRLITARLERRLAFLEGLLTTRTEEYRAITPYSKRKVWYEGKIPPLIGLISRCRAFLTQEPDIRWSPAEIVSLKHLGVESYLNYYVDRFFVTAPDAVQ